MENPLYESKLLSQFSSPKLEKIYPFVQQIIIEELIPLEYKFLEAGFKAIEPALNALREKVKQQGLWLPVLHDQKDNLSLSLTEFAQISEVMALSPLGHYLFNCQAPDIGNIELLSKYASDDIKVEYLVPLIKGEIRSCFSMTEPEFAGSNPVNMATLAVTEGDNYVINGHKWFTSSADGAAFAVVMAVTDPENPNPYARASMIIVPTDNEGFDLLRNISVMGEEGEAYMSHGEIMYKDCKVPLSNLIGQEGAGFLLAQERLGPGRIHHCMRWVGICERALDLMCKRVVARELNNGVLLANKQVIQFWIAEARANIDAARLMVLQAAKMIDEVGVKASRVQISSIKYFVADILMKTLDRSIQAHGALGVTDDTVLSFWYRHERGARIYDGADEVHKSVVARETLKKYGLKLKV
ncbi:MAG: acyl-CoA dehydrogenase family protein [Bacteroidota bacterium]